MEEKVKRTRKKKEVKTKKTETLPVKVQQSGKKLAIKTEEAPKIVVHKIRQPRSRISVAEVLVSTFQKLIKKSLLLLIPWILLSMGVLLAGSYIIFREFFVGVGYPLWYLILVAFLLFGIYGFIGFVYGFAMALLHTVLAVSSSVGENIRKTVLRIKNSLENKVDKFADNLEQNNLLQTIKGTFEDISKNIRKYAAKTAVGVLVMACLGGILFVIKNVMIKSFKKVSNKAEFFTKMSLRFSLLLAIVLNLKLFAKITIAVGYLIGVFLVLSQYLIWHLMR